MSIAALNITINADVGAATSGMRGFSSAAQQAMQTSGGAVDDFRTNLQTASEALQRAAGGIGRNFDTANEAIVRGSARSEGALQKLGDTADHVKFETVGEKIAAAFGAGAGAGYVAAQTWMERTEALVAAKVKVIAIGLAIAAVSATAATVYGAYRLISGTLGFVTGLFTGDSYKSANIDQVIALNNEVKELQRGLSISAIEASALHDALGRLGVSKTDYTSVWTSAEAAMRKNGDELDRLGVKYKDADGRLLETGQFIGNVKQKLDEYRAGWDRSSAAAAIGIGTYEQVSEAVKVTGQELETSKSRLDDYVLGFGPERQAAVAAYEKALREFRNESKLMGDGFAAAISDAVMPAYTAMAAALRDGFPGVVRSFRYSLATIVSLAYGLKTVFDVVADAGIGAVTVLADGFVALGVAAVKALKGDVAGAAKVLQEAWQQSGRTVGKTMDEIVGDAKANRDALLLAWGLDDRTMSVAEARQQRLAANNGKKTWTPAPAAAAATTPKASEYERYLLELDREIAKLSESEYASKRLRAEQLAAKEGITDLGEAYRKIAEIQAGDSAKAVEAFTQKLREEAAGYEFETAILTANTVEREKLVFAVQQQLTLEREIAAAKKAGKPLTDEAIEQLRTETAAATKARAVMIDARDQKATSAGTGFEQAYQEYSKRATDSAALTKNLVAGSLQQAEDAFINFAKTGKLSLGSLFSFMAEEFLRGVFRMQIGMPILNAIRGALAGGGGGSTGGGFFSTVVSAFGGLFGGFRAAGGPVAGGTPYLVGERGPELFVPTASGAVVPNHALAGATGGGTVIDNSGQTFNIGQGVSRAEVKAGYQQAAAEAEARIMRRLRQQGITA